MASTLVKIIVAIAAIAIGVGVTWFYSTIIPTDRNMLILIAIGMTFFSYVALYFMTKGSGS